MNWGFRSSMSDEAKNLSVWWLRTLATLLGLSLPAVALLLRSTLESHLASIAPEQIVQWLILLLAILGLVLTLFFLQLPWLRWDATTSTWVNRFTKTRYCAKCKVDKKLSPLGNETHGWSCPSCGRWYADPNNPSPPPTATVIKRVRRI